MKLLVFGLPLIAFDSAQGAKEIIKNGENGFLIENRNKENFVQKINYIIENSDKKKLFSDNSLSISGKYLKENVSKEWDDFINTMKDKNV